MDLPFCISQEKSVEGVAAQDPNVWGARPPEELFRAQESGQACDSHSAFLCGNSPACFLSDGLGFMKFYTVCIYQP